MKSVIIPTWAQDALEVQSLNVLRKVLSEQQQWVKVHAAEYLIWAGYSGGVREVFTEENYRYGHVTPYRIGIWRVLAQASETDTERKIWTGQIEKAFLNTNAADRLHAAETLAKLRISLLQSHRTITEQTLASPTAALALYTLWSTAFTSASHMEEIRTRLLARASDRQEKEAVVKSVAAYALRQIKGLNRADWKKLAEAALSELPQSNSRVYLLSAAFVTALAGVEQELLDQVRTALLTYQDKMNKAERSELALAMAERGTTDDLPVLLSLLNNQNPLGVAADDYDVMAAAAYAVLKIRKR